MNQEPSASPQTSQPPVNPPSRDPEPTSKNPINVFLLGLSIISILIAVATTALLLQAKRGPVTTNLVTNEYPQINKTYTFEKLVQNDNKFFPITDNGSLTTFSIEDPGDNRKIEEKVDWGTEAIYLGVSHPLPSPNLTKMAYLKEGQLWLSTTDGTSKTSVGDNLKIFLLHSWSPNSRYLLAYSENQDVSSLFGMGIEDTKQFDPTRMPGGYYLIDTESGTYKRVEPLKNVLDWIDNSTLLMFPEDIKEYVIFDIEKFVADTKTFRDSDLKKSSYPQISTIDQSNYWALNIGVLNGNEGTSSLVFTTFPKTTGTEIVKGSWAEYQSPKISPDATKVIFPHFRGSASKIEIWDGKSIKSLADGRPIMWIDNSKFIYLFQTLQPGAKMEYFIFDLTNNTSTPIN